MVNNVGETGSGTQKRCKKTETPCTSQKIGKQKAVTAYKQSTQGHPRSFNYDGSTKGNGLH